MDAIERFADHVVGTGYDDLSPEAVRSAKTFLIDSFGVGVVGSAGPWLEELLATQKAWGSGDDARAWVRGDRLPAPTAALINAYQIHNSEFDCVHEEAVVHPMAVLLGATMAVVERAGNVDGRSLIAAVVAGVDVAANLGVAVSSGLKFFRPGTAGAFAATAAVGKLVGFDRERLREAFSIAYAQLCGTMQAHTEGSTLLPLQIGFNARNAIVACDMAAAGLSGPQNVLEGPFGYLNLFEDTHDLAPCLASLGSVWRITEMAHKPFPSGRATHGIVDGLLELQGAHGFAAGDVSAVHALVPPLTHRLIGRPSMPGMTPNYARLSGQFVAACALLGNAVGVTDFKPDALVDPARLSLAEKVVIEIDGNPDPNALAPVTIAVELASGGRFETTLETIYGNPAKPMTREAWLDKFRTNWRNAARPMDERHGEQLIDAVETLESVGNAAELVDLMVAPS